MTTPPFDPLYMRWLAANTAAAHSPLMNIPCPLCHSPPQGVCRRDDNPYEPRDRFHTERLKAAIDLGITKTANIDPVKARDKQSIIRARARQREREEEQSKLWGPLV